MSFISLTHDEAEIGKLVLDHVTKLHGKASARSWFEPAKTEDYEIICRWKRNHDGSVTLHTGSNFRVEQITQRVLPALKQALGCNVRVEK